MHTVFSSTIEGAPRSVSDWLSRAKSLVPTAAVARHAPIGLHRFGRETFAATIRPSGDAVVVRAEESPLAVKAALRECGIRSSQCRVVVRARDQIVRVFDIPAVRAAKDVAGVATTAMRAEFRQDPALGLAIEDVIVHHQLLSPTRLLVGAVPRKVIGALQEYAAACGLRLAGIDGEGFTLLAVAPEEADSFLFVDGNGATLAARVNGEPREFYYEGASPTNWAPALIACIRDLREADQLKDETPRTCRVMGYAGPPAAADGADVLEQIRDRFAALTISLLPVGVPVANGAASVEPESFLAWALATRGLS